MLKPSLPKESPHACPGLSESGRGKHGHQRELGLQVGMPDVGSPRTAHLCGRYVEGFQCHLKPKIVQIVFVRPWSMTDSHRYFSTPASINSVSYDSVIIEGIDSRGYEDHNVSIDTTKNSGLLPQDQVQTFVASRSSISYQLGQP